MKYIDTDKLKEKVTELIASTRQNDWPIAENYLRRVIDIIDSLPQEQSVVNLEKELQAFLCNYDYEFDDDAPAYDIAKHFYELGQREMCNRITNPEYNKQVVDKMKSEYPIAANEARKI